MHPRPLFTFVVAMMLPLATVSCGSQPKPSTTAIALRSLPQTGYLNLEHGRVWYKIAGAGTGTPLLVLHGGPGVPHDYLDNLAELGVDRPVVFYDQLGCGASDRPDDLSLWTVDFFVNELAEVRQKLGLKDVFIYGHSWGAMLGVKYFLDGPGGPSAGVHGFILAGPALNIPQWTKDTRALLMQMPQETIDAVKTAERTGDYEAQPFVKATEMFYRNHVCRVQPWPADLKLAMEKMGAPVYNKMCGPNEFLITGTLKNVDLSPRLNQINVPVYFICGQYDEATPPTTIGYANQCPMATTEIVSDASHLANLERPEEYMFRLSMWLKKVDTAR